MKLGVKEFLPLLITTFLVVFLSKTPVFAHPGRTAADGCHYCRTRCDYWGVPWNTRHCHGGTAPAPPPKVEPTPTPKIIVPVLTPTPSPEPQLTPEVKGTATQEAQPISTAETIGAFGAMGIIGWGAYRLLRRFIVKKKP